MKNFKKVISAVVALALSASTFVSASNFTDVADTSSYAEAIDVLSSLGIINGYAEEDGTYTFKPEGSITRAEAATMIVGALNMTEDAQASAGTSKFADVNSQASWATGYVNVGVAQGFINGMDDTTFAPQEGVTYAQMCVMLTSIAGYGDYAKSNGGYPTGYTTMAASTGINKGVAVANDTALTRGQVAQMIWNTLQTPMLGVYEYSITGNSYTQLDGSSKAGEFKTLLSDKFDGYVVTATVDQTATSASLETDTAKVKITKADWWGDIDAKIPSTNHNTETVLVYLDGKNVNSALHQSGKAIITEDDFGDFHLVYFATTGKTDTKEFDAADYVMQEDLADANQYSTSNLKVRFGSRYYSLENSVAIYVNGVEMATVTATADTVGTGAANLTTAQATLDKYLGNAMGTITLIDDGAATGYEKILVDIYNIAKVAAVEYDNSETTVSITGKFEIGTSYDEIVISDEALEDGDTIMTVTDKDGNEVALTSLAKDDIIAYKADFKNNSSASLEDPKEIEIIVTNEVINGKVTGYDSDEDTYFVDGTEYEVVSSATYTTGDSYKFYLDPFGRIYSGDKDGTSENYAIALKINTSDQITMVLANGTTKSYDISSSAAISGFTTNTIDGVKAYLDSTSITADKRVIKYTLRTSTSEITKITLATASEDATATAAEYKARTGRLGSSEILATTSVIDATGSSSAPKTASSYSTFNVENFADGATYKYVSYKTGTYTSFVVITAEGQKFNSSSRFAVVRKGAQKFQTDDGDQVEKVIVMYGGDAETEMLFNEDVYKNSGLGVGDVFFFENDNDGFVKNVFIVYDYDNTTKKFTDLATAINNAGFAAADYMDTSDTSDGWSYILRNDNNNSGTSMTQKKDIQLVEGYVIPSTSSNSIALAEVVSPLTKIDTTADHKAAGDNGIALFSVASDVESYLYNVNSTSATKEYDKFAKKDVSALESTGLAKYEADDVYDIANVKNATDMSADANYAVALIVDEVVVAIYAIK